MKILQWFWRKLKFQPPTIYIIRGVSGSGKSTLAGQLTPWNVAADDFPDLYKGGKYNADLQSASHRWCEKSVEDLMQQGRRVIAVHNTSCKVKNFEKFLALAAKYGYVSHVIHAEAVMLSDGSQPGNVHGVAQMFLDRQKSNWESFDQSREETTAEGK